MKIIDLILIYYAINCYIGQAFSSTFVSMLIMFHHYSHQMKYIE